jgi:hypothetical protein
LKNALCLVAKDGKNENFLASGLIEENPEELEDQYIAPRHREREGEPRRALKGREVSAWTIEPSRAENEELF